LLKKKIIKSLKSISFTHGPLNTKKKVKDLPEIFSPNCHLEINKNPKWKAEKLENIKQKETFLWKEFKNLYQQQQDRIKLGEKKKVIFEEPMEEIIVEKQQLIHEPIQENEDLEMIERQMNQNPSYFRDKF